MVKTEALHSLSESIAKYHYPRPSRSGLFTPESAAPVTEEEEEAGPKVGLGECGLVT